MYKALTAARDTQTRGVPLRCERREFARHAQLADFRRQCACSVELHARRQRICTHTLTDRENETPTLQILARTILITNVICIGRSVRKLAAVDDAKQISPWSASCLLAQYMHTRAVPLSVCTLHDVQASGRLQPTLQADCATFGNIRRIAPLHGTCLA